MPARHRARRQLPWQSRHAPWRRPRRPRGRVLLAAILLPVLALGGLYLLYAHTIGRPPAGQADDTARTVPACASSASATGTTRATGHCGTPTPAATPRQSRPGHGRHGPHRRTARHPASPHPGQGSSLHHSPGPSPTSSAGPSPAPVAPVQQPAARQVLALINQARAQAGLAAYTVTDGLDRSSAAHNQRMASGCGLSHQCPGEPDLGGRETAAGVHWTAAGENIGEGGPEPGTASAIAQMALTLTRDMLSEKAPDDGHRLNILSSTFTHIGITIQEDGSGTVWLTQDFSN
jgi:uncharacterized protein YkwD